VDEDETMLVEECAVLRGVAGWMDADPRRAVELVVGECGISAPGPPGLLGGPTGPSSVPGDEAFLA
jgi:hypothetical protein